MAIIILALATLSTPIFKRTYEDLKLVSSAKDLAAIIQLCRERAVCESRPFRLLVDKEKKRYQILAEAEDGKELLPLKERWGKSFKMPSDIDIEAEKDAVDFFPDGTATAATIYLKNKEGKTYTVVIEPATGLVRLYDYKKE